MKSQVMLLKTDKLQSNINECITKLFDDVFNIGDVQNVAIKPNLCYYWKASTGYTTDPRIVSGIIDEIRERFGNDLDIKIVESDATGMRVKHAFTMLDYAKLSAEKEVELFNLSKDESEKIEVKVGKTELSFNLSKTLLETDLLINVPKMKVMRETHITGALKNLFGCISNARKIKYHSILNETIVGVNKVLKPEINIMDGLCALSKYPVKIDALIGSDSPYSMDYVAATIMGYDPNTIKFMQLAKENGLGDPKNIEVKGESINSFKSVFPHVNNFLYKNSFKTLLKFLKLYTYLVGDVVPPILEGI
jgi:uncharacterized protein (DUF362 family)